MSAAAIDAGVLSDAVAQAKAYLKISLDEDDLLMTLTGAAIDLAERFLQQSLVDRPHGAMIEAARGWQRLPSGPVSSIGAVAAIGPSGTAETLSGSDFAIDIDGDAVGWVRATRAIPYDRLSVTYQAGLAADWASVPAAIRQGVVMLAAYLYDNRDGAGAPPAAVTALWRPFRRMRLADRVPA